MTDPDETAKLWKANRTIHELVKDRGSDEDISMDLNTFCEKFVSNGGVDRDQLSFSATSRTNPSDQIFVYFSLEKSTGVKIQS
ncbi:RNA polymerase [Mycena rebaudengoi]|nr:RNA polymerase [Mycena rebaudengoi]KAJ7261043.1 RNA polymerase [Mycena rebaudengoi]